MSNTQAQGVERPIRYLWGHRVVGWRGELQGRAALSRGRGHEVASDLIESPVTRECRGSLGRKERPEGSDRRWGWVDDLRFWDSRPGMDRSMSWRLEKPLRVCGQEEMGAGVGLTLGSLASSTVAVRVTQCRKCEVLKFPLLTCWA